MYVMLRMGYIKSVYLGAISRSLLKAHLPNKDKYAIQKFIFDFTFLFVKLVHILFFYFMEKDNKLVEFS